MDRVEAAKRSYDEVLDATKHQDDKVGRIITAAAFLTTGALTIVTRGGATSVTLILPGATLPIVGIAIGVYFACTAYAVVALVLSLSTPHVHLSAVDSKYESLLFFNEIGRKSREEWEAQWARKPMAIEETLYQNYRRESLNLSRRVLSKYRRTFLAVRVFEVGVLSLAIGGLAYLFAYSSTSHQLHPTYLVRAVFLLCLISYLSLALMAVREQATYDRVDWSTYPDSSRYRRRVSRRLAEAVLFSVCIFELSMVLMPGGPIYLIPILCGLGCVPLLLALTRLERDADPNQGGVWLTIKAHRFKWLPIKTHEFKFRSLYGFVRWSVTFGLIAMGIVVALIHADLVDEARLAAAVSIPVVLLVASILRQTVSLRRWFGEVAG